MTMTTIVTILVILRISVCVAFSVHHVTRSPWDSPWIKPLTLAVVVTTMVVGMLYALGSSGVMGSQPITYTNRKVEMVSISHHNGQASLLYMDTGAHTIKSVELHNAMIRENTDHAALHYENGCRNDNDFIERFAPCSGSTKLISVDLPNKISDLLVGTMPDVDFPNTDSPVAQADQPIQHPRPKEGTLEP